LVIRSLSLRAADYDEIEFYLWTTAPIQDCFPTSQFSQSQSNLVLRFRLFSPQPHSHEKALACAFDAMNLSFLTQLQIETTDHIDSQTLAKTFGKLPLLERVCVQSFLSQCFFDALVYKTKAAEESKTTYCFPNLRYIHLEGTDFLTTRAYTKKSIDMLLNCLMERCERNAEVRTLRLDASVFPYLSSDDIKRLEENVADVIWDRVEKGFIKDSKDDNDE
jgi:hypothetical protein